MGGELFVRDYPDDVDPTEQPDWPGYEVYVEERPDTTGFPRQEAKQWLREWRARRQVQHARQAPDRQADGRTVHEESLTTELPRSAALADLDRPRHRRRRRAAAGALAAALQDVGVAVTLSLLAAGVVLALFVLVPRAAAAIKRHPVLLAGALVAVVPVSSAWASATS